MLGVIGNIIKLVTFCVISSKYNVAFYKCVNATCLFFRVTGNSPPGQKYCSVRLTDKNMLSSSNGPICFYEPDSEKNNPYFKLLALFNTGDRLVLSANVQGKGTGNFNGVQPYFAFNFETSPEDRVVFRLSDGSTHSVRIADCVKVNSSQMWS